MKKVFSLLLAIITLASFIPQQPTVQAFGWLEGTWTNDKQEAFEQWQVVSDSLIQGGSFYRKGKDYVRAEDITVSVVNGSLYYTPTVYGQNNNKPVPFKITLYTDTSFIAENPEHSFPQRIAYTRVTPTRIQAYIEGDVDGKTQRVNFSFTKE
jgi:hypothetical protein